MPRSRQLRDDTDVAAFLHPARAQALELLADGQARTATELAGVVGLTPSAMSWHLRLLERHGFVARDESADGRERPWRATVDDVRLATWSPDVLPGIRTMVTTAVSRAFTQAERFSDEEDCVWVEMGARWYTEDEVASLREELRAVVQRHGSTERRPGDTVRYAPFALGAKVDEATTN